MYKLINYYWVINMFPITINSYIKSILKIFKLIIKFLFLFLNHFFRDLIKIIALKKIIFYHFIKDLNKSMT